MSGASFRHYFQNGKWPNTQLIFADNAADLTVEAITLTDASRANIESYKRVVVDNVKMLSWHINTDGITGAKGYYPNSTTGTEISDVFLKVNDDNIKMAASDTTVENVVSWQQVAGSVIQLSRNEFNPKNLGAIHNSSLNNLVLIGADRGKDITRNSPPLNRSSSTLELLNSTIFSVINMMTGGIKDIPFSNATAEVTPYSVMMIQFGDDLFYKDYPPPSSARNNKQCTGPGYVPYNCHFLDSNGRIEDLTFTNIAVSGIPARMRVIDRNYAASGNFNASNMTYVNAVATPDPFYNKPDTIQNIAFNNVTINGKTLKDTPNGSYEIARWWHVHFSSGWITNFTAN